MPNFTRERLQKITADIFEAGGVPSDEAPIIAELLVASNLAGHDSHGVIRIPQYKGIPIDDETWRQIQETAVEVGIPKLEL